MKRLLFAGIMAFLATGVFAQGWTVDGSINYSNWTSGRSGYTAEDLTNFSLYLKIGKYITEQLNIGFRGGFSLEESGNYFTIGPAIKYDLFQFDRAYLSLFGGLYYARYNSTYTINGENYDANRVVASLAPSVSYMINDMIEVYWQFASISYRYDWVDEVDWIYKEFRLSGPFTNPTFGIIFNF